MKKFHSCSWLSLLRVRSQSPQSLNSRAGVGVGSPAKKELRIGHTCFRSLTEYNEIMDSA